MANPFLTDQRRDNTPSPFYPGYYAGKPLQRDIKKFVQGKPNEYDFDVVTQFIEQFHVDLVNTPKWVIEMAVEDVKRELSVAATPRTPTFDVQRAIETGEVTQEPGAQLKISLNPADWVNDPKKQLNKTLNNWKNEILNQEDWENYVDKRKLWTPLITGRDPDTWFEPGNKLAEAAFHPFNLSDNTAVRGKQDDLFHPDGTSAGKKDTLPYEDAAQGFLRYVEGVDSQSRRKGLYNGFLETSAGAIQNDVKKALDGVVLTNEQAAYKVLFDEKVGITRDMSGVRGLPTNPNSLGKIADDLNRVFLEGDGAQKMKKDKSGLESIRVVGSGGSDGLLDKIYKPSFTDPVTGSVVQNSVAGRALANLDEHRARLAAAEATLIGTPAHAIFVQERKNLDDSLRSYEKYLNDLKDVAEKTKTQLAGTTSNTATARALAGNVSGYINLNKYRFTGEYFDGIEDEFVSNLLNNEMFGNKANGAVGKVLELANSGGRRMERYDNMERVLRTSKRLFEYNEAKDFAKSFTGDKFMEVHVWTRFRYRMNGFTPAQMTRAALKRVHYFGLIYDDDMDDSLRNSSFRHLPFKYLAPTHHVSYSLGGRTFRLEGGSHMQGAKGLYKYMENGQLGSFGVNKRLETMDAAGMGDVIRLMNFGYSRATDPSIAHLALGSSDADLLAGNLRQIEALKLFLIKKGIFDTQTITALDRFGNSKQFTDLLINDANKKKLFEFLKQSENIEEFRKDLLSITASRAGLLQHLSSYANQIQVKIESTLGKLLAPYFQLRKAVIEIGSEMLAAVVSAVVAGITAGLGTAVAPIVDRAIKYLSRFVVGKVVNFIESFNEALFKGDFSKFFYGIQKDFDNFVRRALYFAVIPVAFFMIVAFMFGGFLSSTPHVEVTGTPYNSPTGDGSATTQPPPILPDGGVSCPLNNTAGRQITTWSLGDDDGTAKFEHGSTSYWNSPAAGGTCFYSIPYVSLVDAGLCPDSGNAACAPSSSSLSNNTCYRIANTSGGRWGPQQPYYGFAIDVTNNDKIVYLPKIGHVAKWEVSSRFSIFQAARGYGVILDGVDTDGTTYKLYLAHLDGIWLDTASAEAPGTPLAKLFGPLNHVHIEVMQNGTPQKPEDLGICTT